MFALDQVLPWGRSFDEYRRMFSLTEADLGRRIVGCGDGPASFNAEASRRGGQVTSIDPLYQFQKSDIEARIAATSDEILEQTRANAHEFVWDAIGSVDALGQIRLKAMQDFLEDYDRGRVEGRYVNAALPDLPFADAAFDLRCVRIFSFCIAASWATRFTCRRCRRCVEWRPTSECSRCSPWVAAGRHMSMSAPTTCVVPASTSRSSTCRMSFSVAAIR